MIQFPRVSTESVIKFIPWLLDVINMAEAVDSPDQ